MTERCIKGGEMGQNGSQCGCTGVKHDQTAQLNRGIIVPKLCERERDGGRERLWVALLSCLVTHTLDNAGSVSFPLWLKHSLMHILDAWTFAPGPHALQREREREKKKKKIFVYRTTTSEQLLVKAALCLSSCNFYGMKLKPTWCD